MQRHKRYLNKERGSCSCAKGESTGKLSSMRHRRRAEKGWFQLVPQDSAGYKVFKVCTGESRLDGAELPHVFDCAVNQQDYY